MLKHLINKKIDEIFTAYQKANNITNGDIDPWEAERLEQIKEALEASIERICAKQLKKIIFDDFAPSWYIYTDSEGTAHSETYGKIDIDKFFTAVSKRICFDDLSDETVQKIYYKGKEVYYVGWQPKMVYEYKDLDGNTIWLGNFPEWDH